MTATVAVRVEVLGPLQLRVHGALVDVRGAKLRAVIARLALAEGRIVSVDDLLDTVWGEDLPATARNALQQHVRVLRKALARHDAAACLATREPGYALAADTDAGRFLAGASQAGRAASAGRHGEAADSYTAALNLWRGRAFADLRDFEFAAMRAVALEDQRLTCLEAWGETQLASGQAEALIGPLHALVAENPTRERLWEQLMIALYRTGRQDAALSAYRTARAALDRELGVLPTARLSALHQAILAHDPALLPSTGTASPPRPGPGLTSTTLVRSVVAPEARPTLTGPGSRRVELTDAGAVLGRHAGCDLVLADDQASRRHAQVLWTAEGWMVVDLGSTNGTFLNGSRLMGSVVLADGDRIEVGHSVVRFSSGRRCPA